MPIVSPKKFARFRENVLCLTQPELAERWGVSKTRISDIERADGTAEIRPPNFRKLAEIAGLTVEQLLHQISTGGADAKPTAPTDAIDLTPLSAEELAGLKARIRDEEARRRSRDPVIRDPVGPGPGRRRGGR